jgi:3-methylcrotonyl-CoA carboxylase alpha subunit
VRLYAEDPVAGFLPSIGPLTHFRLPDSVRIDSGVEEGGEVTSYYDPMLGKMIAAGPARIEAAERLVNACRQVEVWPVKTNAAFLARTLSDPDFIAGKIDTSFIETHIDRLLPDIEPSERIIEAAARQRLAAERVITEPWRALEGFRLNAPPHVHVSLQSGQSCYHVELSGNSASAPSAQSFENTVVVFSDGNAYAFTDPKTAAHAAGPVSTGRIVSPMPGRIVAVPVKAGDRVAKGQAVVIVEAMKIEHTLRAPFKGTVKTLSATQGEQVSEGMVLAQIDAGGDANARAEL